MNPLASPETAFKPSRVHGERVMFALDFPAENPVENEGWESEPYRLTPNT